MIALRLVFAPLVFRVMEVYGHPIVLSSVSSENTMPAYWKRLSYDVLARISTRIMNSVVEVNRVVLDVTPKPPVSIEGSKTSCWFKCAVPGVLW